VWARGESDGAELTFEARFRDRSDDWIEWPSVTYATTSEWAQYNLGTYQAPPSTNNVQIVLKSTGSPFGSVFVDDVATTAPPAKAILPDPGLTETGVPVSKVLSWVSADPNATKESVYFGTTGTSPLPLVAEELPAFTQTWTPPADLEYDTQYSWRVDLIKDSGNPAGHYTVVGDEWTFTTITKAPLITSDPNAVWVNGSMTVSATEYDGASTGNLSYQWYDSSGAVSDDTVISGSSASGVGTSTLTFTAPDASYAGSYYCVVEDTVEALTADSASAPMDLPRLFAHFTFEPGTINGANVQNIISGGYEAQTVDADHPDWTVLVDYEDGKVGGQAVVFEDPRNTTPAGDGDDNWMEMWDPFFDPVFANGGKQITIAMWANPSETVLNKQALFSVLDTDWADNLTVLCPTVTGGDTIRFQDQDGAESVEWTFDANEVTNQWHHFAFSKNVDTGDMKIYMDGDLKATTNAALADFVTDISSGIFLGAHQNYNESFTGLLDDFRLYNYALSDAEVTQLYACSSLAYDLDFSCNVDLIDYAKLAEQWDGGAGGGYDIDDLAGLCSEWLDDNTL
jgi:hypothetical protein